MRRVLAGVVVAAAGVVGVAGVASATDPKPEGPGTSMCVDAWKELHPEFTLGQRSYIQVLYYRYFSAVGRISLAYAFHPGSRAIPRIGARMTEREAAMNWQIENCMPDWRPRPR